MKRKKGERNMGEAAKLEMTPMIDVVFQLLIFFIVTLKVEDIYSHLDVSRPAPDPKAKPEEKVDDLLTVTIYNHKKLGGEGFSINGKRASGFTDNKPERLQSGMIGLQIHDAGMVVEFKDILLKKHNAGVK